MHVVFLTGGLASGKSTVAAWLDELGATVLDLDQMAKEEQESPAVLAELQEAFGSDIIDAAGQLDRKLLAARAFVDQQSAERLNAICWPPVIERLSEYLVGGSCQPIEHGSIVVVQVPLLVEASELLDLADEVVTISAPEHVRLMRAVERGMSATDAERRLALQATDAEREAISNTVFENTGDLATLHQAVREWYEQRVDGRLF